MKKTDNLEAYVWRDDDGMICIPGSYVHRAMVEAGRFIQDPRSARKSPDGSRPVIHDALALSRRFCRLAWTAARKAAFLSWCGLPSSAAALE